jgi:hypothetical protein
MVDPFVQAAMLCEMGLGTVHRHSNPFYQNVGQPTSDSPIAPVDESPAIEEYAK